MASQFRIGEAASERRHRLVDLHGSPYQSLAQGLLGPRHIAPIGEAGRYQGGAGQLPPGMGRVSPLRRQSTAAEPKRGRLARLSRRIRTCPPPAAQHLGIRPVRTASPQRARLESRTSGNVAPYGVAAGRERRRWRSTTSAPLRPRGSSASSSTPPARRRSGGCGGARRHGGRRPHARGEGRRARRGVTREAVQALRDRAVTGKVVLPLG
jgi:hypothetical protein